MERERIKELIAVYRDGLLKDTIPFWMKHNLDRECGGFYNYLDADGTLLSTDKPVWIQGRYTWLMALLYNQVEKRQEWLDRSRHGVEFLDRYCFDTDGRMFFEVTRRGQPLRKRRYTYTEAFGQREECPLRATVHRLASARRSNRHWQVPAVPLTDCPLILADRAAVDLQ